MATNVVMPQLGESVIEGTVGKWLKQTGDKVEQYEPVMEVVTDKVTTEIPSPAAGTLLQILVPEGTTVKAGTVLAVIGQPGEEPAAPPAMSPAEGKKEPAAGQNVAESRPASPAAERKKEPAEATPTASTVAAETRRPEKRGNGAALRLTPVVARMMAEYQITPQELENIRGTGEGGRVSKKDLEKYIQMRGAKPAPAPTGEPTLAPWEMPGTGDLFKPTEEGIGRVKPRAAARPAAAPAAPAAPPAPSGERPEGAGTQERAPLAGADEELVPLTPMRRSIAEHMVRSQQTSPHVTTVHEADMTRVIEHMKAHQDEFTKQGARLTFTPYLVQAIVHALKQTPLVNALFTEQGILMRRRINIGIAVAVEEGLLVPVIKNADEKSLLGLARAVNDLAQRARDKRLSPEDVQGGTFTITNYGVFGSLFGTPIINQPQSAILGVGTIQKRAVVIQDAIAIRPMVYLGLTFDHRLLDGATGDRFMSRVKEFLTQYSEY